ncbi:hypothetical protein AAVH_39865, partial [Aphelenchoides avenae]
ENGSRVRSDLHTVCARFFEFNLQGTVAEPAPWIPIRSLTESEERAAGLYELTDIVAHRVCDCVDHGHLEPALEFAAVWAANRSTTWVAASSLSTCAQALVDYGARCAMRFVRRRGRFGQLRRVQSAQELGSASEFHRRRIPASSVLDAAIHGGGCTALDRRRPLRYRDAYPERPPDAVEEQRYSQWRRRTVDASAHFPRPSDKCNVQAGRLGESPEEERTASEERWLHQENFGASVEHFIDAEAEDAWASDPPELEPRRRMGCDMWN